MMPPEEIKARALAPDSIELTWKIPTNLRRDKLKFNIVLRYYNTRQTEEQAAEVKISKVFLVHDEDVKDPDEKISGKFILRGLTRNIEYKLQTLVRIYLNVPDWERPGMMKEEVKESYPSGWQSAYTSTKIYSGFFNFTQILYKNEFKDHSYLSTKSALSDVTDTFERTIFEIEQQYLSIDNLELIESPFNRTYANITFFISMDSSSTAKGLQERVRNIWASANHGLDFRSIEILDYNECDSKWNDCDEHASCRNVEGSFLCQCAEGFSDHSKVLAMPPGRVCKNATSIDPNDVKAVAIGKAEAESAVRFAEDEDFRDEITGGMPQNPMIRPTLPAAFEQYITIQDAGEWTEGIDWPGPVRVKSKVIGPTSIQLTWPLIDHDLHGERLYYVVGFRLAGAEKWTEWTLGAKQTKVSLNGMMPNRQYEMKVGLKQMDINPGSEVLIAWSKPLFDETFLNTYKATLILQDKAFTTAYKNEYSGSYVKMSRWLRRDTRQIFGNSAMGYIGKSIRDNLIDMGEFNYVPSMNGKVVANWKLYFRPTQKDLLADTIDKVRGFKFLSSFRQQGLHLCRPKAFGKSANIGATPVSGICFRLWDIMKTKKSYESSYIWRCTQSLWSSSDRPYT